MYLYISVLICLRLHFNRQLKFELKHRYALILENNRITLYAINIKKPSLIIILI